jgi:hypothetical protein
MCQRCLLQTGYINRTESWYSSLQRWSSPESEHRAGKRGSLQDEVLTQWPSRHACCAVAQHHSISRFCRNTPHSCYISIVKCIHAGLLSYILPVYVSAGTLDAKAYDQDDLGAVQLLHIASLHACGSTSHTHGISITTCT